MSALDVVRPLASGARFLASSLMLTMGVRVAVVAWSAGGVSPAGAPSAAPVSSVAGSSSARAPSPSGVAPTSLPKGSIRVPISVDSPEDRADVYIEGVKRGQTPFLGDVTCVPGKKFVVEVAPKSGARQRFDKTCAPGVLRIK